MQELNKIRVTWQLAVIVCALAFLPVAAVALISVIAEPGQRGESGVKIVCGSVIVFGVLLCVLAVRSRLSPVTSSDERISVLKLIALGVLVIAAAAGLTAVSYFFGTFSAMGSQWYLVPTGLYVAGLVMIGRAMVPDED